MTLIKFCSLLSCHKVAKNFLKAHDTWVLEMTLIYLTAFLQLNTQHTADQIYCIENCVCLSYLYETAFRRCFYQVYFNHSSAGVGWAWLCGFVWFFNRRSPCVQPTPCEQPGHCVPQQCDGELNSCLPVKPQLYQYLSLVALQWLWLKHQIAIPSPFVLPAEFTCWNAKLETLIQTGVSKSFLVVMVAVNFVGPTQGQRVVSLNR